MKRSFIVWCAAAAGWLAVGLVIVNGHGADRREAKPQVPVVVELADTGGTDTRRNVRIDITPKVDLPAVQVFVATTSSTGLGRRTVLFEGAASAGVRRTFQGAVDRAAGESILGGVSVTFPGGPPWTHLVSLRPSQRFSSAKPLGPLPRTADGEPVIEHVIP